jgi:NADPH:quinone reductase-like Zn-dependent oxidoreductase
VSFGQASGDIGPREIGPLAAKSLRLSRPNYAHYTDTPEKLARASACFFAALRRGEVTIEIGREFPLAAAAEAHRALEARATTGSTILIPGGEGPA